MHVHTCVVVHPLDLAVEGAETRAEAHAGQIDRLLALGRQLSAEHKVALVAACTVTGREHIRAVV